MKLNTCDEFLNCKKVFEAFRMKKCVEDYKKVLMVRFQVQINSLIC